VVFTLTLGLTEKQNKPEEELVKLIKPGTFGDIGAFATSSEYADTNNVFEVLTVFTGEYPFIMIRKEPSGEISRLEIIDGMESENELVRINFEKGRMAELFLLGNSGTPVFTVEASEKPGIWREAMYTPSVSISETVGTWKDYMPVGDVYTDLDFDGRFDVKTPYDAKGKIIDQYLFVNGEWQKLNYLSLSKSEGGAIINSKRVYYDFECGKGWKKRSD
jgi:hypothetical protein